MDRDSFAPFGEMLRDGRRCKGITQQQLATKLGLHRNTIGSWERGDYLPESRGMVIELARHLRLNDEEARRLLEASLTATAPYWSVPALRNPFFTGREKVLEELHTHLCPDQAAPVIRSQALYGLGGIGKTQVAVEYAYQHALEYSAVFWLAAETTENLMNSMQQAANRLQLPERQATEQLQMVMAVQRWLETHSGWLLIGDNVEDFDLFQTIVPPSAVRQGALLLTTRRQALGMLAEPRELLPMSREEGVALVLRRARRPGVHDSGAAMLREDRQRDTLETLAARELVQLLEGLPLALDQAGAYIEETGCKVEDYVQRYRDQRKYVLAHRGMHGGAHPASVATTLGLSVKQIEQEHPEAADLLRVCAFLHPEAIPEEVLTAGAAQLGPVLSQVVADPCLFDSALAALRHASLVTRHAETRTLSVHRLVQALLQDQMEPAEARLWSERAIRVLHAVFPGGELHTWSQCERLLPHVLTCAGAIGDAVCSQELMELLHRAGGYLAQRGRYEQAESLLQQVRRMQEQIMGPNHPRIATSLDFLAHLARDLGKYEEAEALFHQALRMSEQTLGTNHPDVARVLTGLAALYTDRGKYKQAEPLYERALSIWAQTPEPEHPDMARPLNGLAVLCYHRGKHEQAARLYERALCLRERTLGAEHPEVAMTLSNLAEIYQAARKYGQAERLYQQALRIWEQTVGLDHPYVAFARNNLGEIYREQKRYEQAAAFSRQALRLWEQAVGPKHVLVAHPLHNLAEIAHGQGKDDRAEALFKQALQIRERHLESTHPEIATTLNSLATLYRDREQYEQAEPLYQRALAIREQCLGSRHPGTVAIRRAYHELLERRREAAGARKRERQEQARLEAASEQVADHFRHFLAARCNLDPRAWSRSSELWQVYECWVEHQQVSLVLSRRAFAHQLRAHGCRAGRTNTARLWRGVAVLKKAL